RVTSGLEHDKGQAAESWLGGPIQEYLGRDSWQRHGRSGTATHLDRLHAGGNCETDGIRAGRAIGIDNSLAQRAGTAIGRARYHEGGRHCPPFKGFDNGTKPTTLASVLPALSCAAF